MEKKIYEIFGKVLTTYKPKVSFIKMNERFSFSKEQFDSAIRYKYRKTSE